MSGLHTCTGGANVILHAFDWKYADIAERAQQIHQLGYGSVLVSPAMTSAQNHEWWQRYQPQDYRVIDNALGNTTDFKRMVQALAHYDIWVYADVVFNHMANESGIRSDLNYPSQTIMAQYQSQPEHYQALTLFGDLSQPLFTEHDFVEAFGIEDWKDKWQVQNGRITGGASDPGLPTLKVNEHVIEQQRQYLKALKQIGVKGFRIDAAKHMTQEHIAQVWSDDIVDDIHIFGEIITDGGATEQEYEIFLQPYLEHTQLGAYDFPLFSTMYQAFTRRGSFKSLINPYCFGQALSNKRAITFAITHDIPNNEVFQSLIMREEDEWLAYAYILGRDGGVPLIYTDLDTSGIRSKEGSPRWQNAWKDPRMAKMIEFHNRTHGEPMQILKASSDILVIKRGNKGVLAINKSTRSHTIKLNLSASYCDLIQGNMICIDNKLKMGAKSASMLLAQTGSSPHK
ncbi:alpha-amylase family glycosyl hydrolase [Vibrio hippocampi]|uniref:Alpha-amylase n=1 Tax=Vibrio hippocampi TaxID=654686 RepID=A0ABN8DIR5_9VIBR|nr:alpha-amylase family glycosyl hydrolase [Vibrio hippocampi]CAH0526650.1 Alpha-amylase [Vibrio hippocampi]